MPAAPVVRAGAVVALRLFDIAYAIDLARAEAIWAAGAGAASRARLSATPAKAMAFGVPPLALTLDPLTLDLDGARVAAEVTARLYDFGAVALAVRVPAADLPWPDYVALAEAIDRRLNQQEAPEVWGVLLARLRETLAAALERPAASVLQEDYLIGVVRSFDTKLGADELQQRIDLAPLLSGETRELSPGMRAELLRQRFSYYADDLVVITWDRAFVFEPRGESDVLDVLEVANAQLLEMRYYDELLDAELPRMYDMVERTRRTTGLLAPRRFADLARRLFTLVAEVTELTEKVDNALQVTEDVYLARVYASALDLFRVRTVSAAVERKLAIIRDTYQALYDEASGARSAWVELLILILIAVEIVLAVRRH